MREKRSQVRKAILDASRKRDNCDVMTYATRIHLDAFGTNAPAQVRL